MTFVLLYGPPAVGKLRAAKELARLTGFKVFHNHLSVDFTEEIFTRNSPSFGQTVKALNQVVFEETAQTGVNLIYTFVYAHPQDNPEVRWMLDIFEKNGANIFLVQLICQRETLKVRLGETSWQAYGKIKDAKTLEGRLTTYDLFTPYPARLSLKLDTTTTSPQETAAAIFTHLQNKGT